MDEYTVLAPEVALRRDGKKTSHPTTCHNSAAWPTTEAPTGGISMNWLKKRPQNDLQGRMGHKSKVTFSSIVPLIFPFIHINFVALIVFILPANHFQSVL
jgi:hypothetical protein